MATKKQKSPRKEERSYGLTPERVQELKAEHAKSKQFPNPHSHAGSAYGGFIAALVKLGVNHLHPFAKVKAATVTAMGKEAWAKFARKDADLKVDERIMLNARVLQRPDYGRRLLETGTKVLGSKGAVVDIVETEAGWTYRLNTDSPTPLYQPLRKSEAAKGAGKPAGKRKAAPVRNQKAGKRLGK